MGCHLTSRVRRALPRENNALSGSKSVARDLLPAHPVVGGFLGHDHIVRVALPQTGRGDLHELSVALQAGDIRRAHVPIAERSPPTNWKTRFSSGPL